MDGHVYRVDDVMTRRVIALAGGATFKDIVRTMETQRISALPVIDSGSHVIGVVSEADVLRKEEFRDSDHKRGPRSRTPGALAKARAVTAEDLMTTPAVTVQPEAPVARAARLMARHRVKRLPVVDREGVLQGIVSRADLLRVFLRSDPDIAEEVRREIVGSRFPEGLGSVRVEVHEGVVTLTGRVPDTSLVPLAERLVRSVEGVVDVRCALTGPRHRPVTEPDLMQEEHRHTSEGR
ncbi:CBS domain-containing protein [Streptomyces sp. MPA0124]|uniref:CBS domain-containing protein n=2 Tax=Streptomyces tendae TaxID=1932 RepID=A0ABW7RY52_STRTE|nr:MULTISPECIES: CBS domain-containing protein [Streptomyces]AIV32710.1 CBS domain-containing protein [Streptomyces sp. CCM_MD2014]MDA4888283.1 CBS domain-containing protein [Streptomyces sp. MS2A]BET45985.1 CBS domain-containing protein [Kitasatospora aureofaciens]